MSRLLCKNIDVMSSICSKSKKFCIHCAGYEAREFINCGDDIAKVIKVPEITREPLVNENKKNKYNGK